MMQKDTSENRQSIIDACLWMNSSGLNQGTSGNISIRTAEGILITPSSLPYEETR
ncbi:MAG: L-fuculose-phosphate aldolase, partial [Candidatus Azotimanducaceae bacterium]